MRLSAEDERQATLSRSKAIAGVSRVYLTGRGGIMVGVNMECGSHWGLEGRGEAW